MAVALVARTGPSFTGGDSNTTSGINTSGANFLYVSGIFFTNSASGITISDSNSNTWTALTPVTVATSGGNVLIQTWYAKNATVGSGHTVTVGKTSTFPSAMFWSFSGVDTVSPFDVETSNSTTSVISGGAGLATGSVTPAVNGSLLMASVMGSTSGTWSITDSFTTTGVTYEGSSAYKVQATAAASNPSWSIASSATGRAAHIAVFKAGAGSIVPILNQYRQRRA